jgi:UDP-4-amino-4-deoxy-L-arabinose-oxoglutarate aminotransferase
MGEVNVPFYRHSLTPDNSKFVEAVLKTPFLTSGPIGKEVESQLCEYFNVSHAKLVNSWTNGAVATLLAMDIGPGDEVIVPAMTFVATANVVELVGAKPVFIDCDPDTLLVTPELIKAAITEKTKAVIPVHMYGQMCDVAAIKAILPNKQNISIIEDCAHSFEAKYNDERPGKYSNAAIFSFYATKNITCGEGGAIITNDSNLFDRITQSILHGMSASAADRFKTGQYKHWEMEHLGTKANLPDLLASLLPNQINSIDSKLNDRHQLALKYEQAFGATKLRLPKNLPQSTHSRHLFALGVSATYRDQVLSKLAEFNIGATVNYRSITSLKYYQNKYKLDAKYFVNSVNWGGSTISIPLFVGLTESEQEYIIKVMLQEILPMLGQDDS